MADELSQSRTVHRLSTGQAGDATRKARTGGLHAERARRHPLIDLGIGPRLLTREQAAAYCGLSASGFSEWVRSGKLPGPIRGSTRWDLKAIDAALDSLSGIGPGTL